MGAFSLLLILLHLKKKIWLLFRKKMKNSIEYTTLLNIVFLWSHLFESITFYEISNLYL